MNKTIEYPTIITGDDAVNFAESTHIGSGDGITVGNLALLAAITTQDQDPSDPHVSVAIYNAFN